MSGKCENPPLVGRIGPSAVLRNLPDIDIALRSAPCRVDEFDSMKRFIVTMKDSRETNYDWLDALC